LLPKDNRKKHKKSDSNWINWQDECMWHGQMWCATS